jgi:hypothetical protein
VVRIAVPEVPVEEFSMIGKTVSHYRIIEKLGGGGMGVARRASPALGSRVKPIPAPRKTGASQESCVLKPRFSC